MKGPDSVVENTDSKAMSKAGRHRDGWGWGIGVMREEGEEGGQRKEKREKGGGKKEWGALWIAAVGSLQYPVLGNRDLDTA